jgi:nicotinamide mononucleotide transporter
MDIMLDLSHFWAFMMQASPWEWAGALLGVIYVLGAIRERPWSWWASLLSTLAYIVIFGRAALWGQCALQVFYVLASVYGYWAWSDSQTRPAVRISVMSHRETLLWMSVTAVGSGVLWWSFNHWGVSESALDAITSVSSLSATYLATQKRIENWLWWILIDGAVVGLCLNQQLWLSAGLYVAFVVLAALGFVGWRRNLNPHRQFYDD